MELQRILEEREKTHGDFKENARIFDLLMKAVTESIVESNAWTPQMDLGLTMIVGKLARILSGNPQEPDHWRDIAGYATLVAKNLEEESSDIL